MTDQMESQNNSVTLLIKAARRTWQAYLKFGPVDDGRPEGKELEAALDALMEATYGAKYDPESGYCPTIEVLVCCVRTPNGRGRNSAHWEGTIDGEGWSNGVRGPNEDVVVGKLVLSYLRSGNPPARVVIRYVDSKERNI